MYVCMLLQLRPENSEEFIEYLISIGNLDEAAVKLADVVNNVSVADVVNNVSATYLSGKKVLNRPAATTFLEHPSGDD